MSQQDILFHLKNLYPNCTFANLHWIGDGVCDYKFGLDVEACGFDGGDCDGVWYPKSGDESSEKGVGFWPFVVVGITVFLTVTAYAAKRSKSNQQIAAIAQSDGIVPRDLSKSSQEEAAQARRGQVLSYLLLTRQIKKDECTNKEENEANIQEVVQSSDNSDLTASLPTTTLFPWRKNSEPECSICMSPFADGETIAWSKQQESCNHCYHLDCIAEWLCNTDKRGTYNDSCPLCRSKIGIPPSGEENV